MFIQGKQRQDPHGQILGNNSPWLARSAHRTTYQVRYQQAPGVYSMRVLVGLGIAAMAYFLWWFRGDEHVGYAPLFWLLTVSLGFKLLRMLHEWVHYVQVRSPLPPLLPVPVRRVDVLTTAYPGEPHAMIVRTLESMQALHYPHTSYLCDEGDDPLLREECRRLGVVHVTRRDKVHAKAGNINNALRQATGEFCVVLDPDHVLEPDFLDQVMPYFADEHVGFVQVVQAYGNQQESLVARGAAEQTYHFYGPMMMGMNAYGTVQAIGANCTFRRAALDSIGGHAAGLTEDMHTAMRLHAAGWQSVYVPKILSRGLVPSSLAAFCSQQLKWSRGAFDLLLRVYPRLWNRFSWPQRLHYLTLPLYFFSGVVTLIDIAVPIVALSLTEFPWRVSLQEFALHMLPLASIALLIRMYAQQWLREPEERGLHLAGGILRVATWWVYVLGFAYAVLGVRVPYIPTPKAEGYLTNEWRIALPNLAVVAILVAACKYGRMQSLTIYTHMMVGLALILAGILLAATAMGQHDALRNLVRDMATRPCRPFVLGLHRFFAQAAAALAQGLQRGGLKLPLGVAGMLGAGHLLISLTKLTSMPDLNWVKTGGYAIHTGLAPSSLPPMVATSSMGKQILLNNFAIVPLVLTGGNEPFLPAQVLRQLPANQVPLLSWSIPSLTRSATYWRKIARQFRQVTDRPLMVRPLFPVGTALAHRRAWRQLIEAFRAEKVGNVAWLWTPPRPDALALYSPGAAYVDWLVSDHPAVHEGYLTMRRQVATQFDLHPKPVVLLTPVPQFNPRIRNYARRVAIAYPEIKAIVFDRPASIMTPYSAPKQQAVLIANASSFHPYPVLRRTAQLSSSGNGLAGWLWK